MRRYSRSGFTMLFAALALLGSTVLIPPPAAAGVELGADAAIAARYSVKFAAANGSRVSGNGQIVVRTGAELGLGGGLGAEVAVKADASFQLKGLKPTTRYSVVVTGTSQTGAVLSQVCAVETGEGDRSGVAQGGCATTFAGLAAVGAVSLHEGGPDGQLVARSRVAASIGIRLGLGLGL